MPQAAHLIPHLRSQPSARYLELSLASAKVKFAENFSVFPSQWGFWPAQRNIGPERMLTHCFSKSRVPAGYGRAPILSTQTTKTFLERNRNLRTPQSLMYPMQSLLLAWVFVTTWSIFTILQLLTHTHTYISPQAVPHRLACC